MENVGSDPDFSHLLRKWSVDSSIVVITSSQGPIDPDSQVVVPRNTDSVKLLQKRSHTTGLIDSQNHEERHHLELAPHVQEELPVSCQLSVSISSVAHQRPNDQEQESEGVHGEQGPGESFHGLLGLVADVADSSEFVREVGVVACLVLNQEVSIHVIKRF